MDISQILLFLATQKQVDLAGIKVFEQWGQNLTIEEWVKRADDLRRGPHSASGKWNM
jgi:hypothetical protein